MMHRLSLVAHAPTTALRQFRFPDDESIETLGPDRVARVASIIGRCEKGWCTPERRTAETALALGSIAIPQPELRAWSMGEWTGRPVADVAEEDPIGFAAWRADPDGAPAGGESFRELVARVGSWVAAHAPCAGRELVVADPAVIRAAVVHVLGAGHQAFWRLDLEPLSLTVLQHATGQTRVRMVGATLR